MLTEAMEQRKPGRMQRAGHVTVLRYSIVTPWRPRNGGKTGKVIVFGMKAREYVGYLD